MALPTSQLEKEVLVVHETYKLEVCSRSQRGVVFIEVKATGLNDGGIPPGEYYE